MNAITRSATVATGSTMTMTIRNDLLSKSFTLQYAVGR
jgi:hypothetical protein